MSEPYITNSWAGLPHYECADPSCPFDTLDERAMHEHVAQHEAAVAQQQAVEAARAASQIEQQPEPAAPAASQEESDHGEDRVDEDRGAVPGSPDGGSGGDVHGG